MKKLLRRIRAYGPTVIAMINFIFNRLEDLLK